MSSTVGRLPGTLHLPAGRYSLELTPNPEHAAVADSIARDRAPEGSRIEFEARPADGRVLAIGRAAGGVALALEEPPEPIEAPPPARMTPQQVEAAVRDAVAAHAFGGPRRDGACAKCH